MQRPRDAWILVLVVGTGSFLILERALAATGNPGLTPSILLLGAVTAPAAFVGLVGARGLRFTVPGWTLGAGAVLGGGIGLGGAAIGPELVGLTVAEDALLLLLAAGALWALPHRRVTDGLLIGASIGAGFAVCGTVGLTIGALADAGGRVDDDVHAVLVAGLFAPAAQMAWTGLAAAALWRAAQDGWTGPALRRLVLVGTVVTALHASAGAARTLPVTLLVTALGFAALVWFTQAAGPVPASRAAAVAEAGAGDGARPRFPQPGPMPVVPAAAPRPAKEHASADTVPAGTASGGTSSAGTAPAGTAASGTTSSGMTARSAMNAPTHPLPVVPGR